MSLIPIFLKGMAKSLAVDDHNAKHLSDHPCVYNLIEEALYMWIVSNVIQQLKKEAQQSRSIQLWEGKLHIGDLRR